MKNKIILMEAIVIAVCFLFLSRSSQIKQERDRYKRNMDALTETVDSFRLANNELVSHVSSLELSEKEFKRLYENESDIVKRLKRKNSELTDYIKTEVSSQRTVETVVKDSLVYVRDSLYLAKVFDWADEWDSVHAVIAQDSVIVDLAHSDSIDIALSTEWKRFLGFLWKTKIKGYEVDVVSHNPHTKEVYVESVKIK